MTRQITPNAYERPPFLDGGPYPVELVQRLTVYALNGQSLVLHCETARHQPVMADFYGTTVEITYDAPMAGAPVTIQIDFYSPSLFRLRCVTGSEVAPNITPMLTTTFAQGPAAPVSLKLHESPENVTIVTEALQLTVIREPFQLRAARADGTIIFETKPTDIEGLRRPVEQWNPPQQRWMFLHRHAYPLGSACSGEREFAFLSFDLHYDEHIYGFGEAYGRLDKRDTEQLLWIQEALGNAGPASYKKIPFYLSTRGYGLFINTARPIRANVGDREHTALSLTVEGTTSLDVFCMTAAKLADILPQYTAITGQPAVPPKWSFGLWMGRITYTSRAQVERIASELRDHRIPCDVIHLDTGWYERDWICDLKFGPTNFPDPATMLTQLREAGFRVSVWQWPNMVVTSPLYFEARDGGYLARTVGGEPYMFSGFAPEAGYIDYSNPAAVAWITAKFRSLFELGVAAIKVDFGEGAQPDARYDAMAPDEAHNLYPLLYNRAVFEATEAYFGKGNALIWARAAWAGSQRYPVHWSGDGVARYEDLACVLRAMLSFGLSGFPFYAHDVGGFSGVPSPDLYVRWAQLAFFSSHVRCHGMPPREPWDYGDEAERCFREADELRYRLLPYVYSESMRSASRSLPMARALVLEFQDDPTACAIEDQYMFGHAFLVAPILDATNRRQVYLPSGHWFDYWSKAPLEGGRWLTVVAPLDRIPLYVRAGSIIPLGPVMQYTDEKPCDPLTIEVYQPAAGSTYTVSHTPQNQTQVTISETGGEPNIEVSSPPGEVQIRIYRA